MTTTSTTIIDPVGINEIAELLGVKTQTVNSWRKRAKTMTEAIPLPEPEAIVTKTPIWSAATITAWAEQTGRSTVGPGHPAYDPARDEGYDYEDDAT